MSKGHEIEMKVTWQKLLFSSDRKLKKSWHKIETYALTENWKRTCSWDARFGPKCDMPGRVWDKRDLNLYFKIKYNGLCAKNTTIFFNYFAWFTKLLRCFHILIRHVSKKMFSFHSWSILQRETSLTVISPT